MQAPPSYKKVNRCLARYSCKTEQSLEDTQVNSIFGKTTLWINTLRKSKHLGLHSEKIHFGKIHFEKIHFGKIYFQDIHFQKIQFPKIYFQKIQIWRKKYTFGMSSAQQRRLLHRNVQQQILEIQKYH